MQDLLSELRSILAGTPLRWTNLAQTISAELFLRQPAPQEWSAFECLQHILDTEYAVQYRLQAFLDGHDFPDLNADDQDGKSRADQTPVTLAAEFALLRQQSLESLEKITPADFDLPALHPRLGPVKLEQMLNEWAAHDLNHAIQAEEAIMQPFISASGPWQVFFTGHLAAASK